MTEGAKIYVDWLGGAVMAVDTGRLPLLSRWCGLALVAAGVLMVVATLLHPSRETATRSSPASRGWLRRMWFTRWLGCWCCSAFPASMRPIAAGWDGWGWSAC
jgi:hypothetical protein